MGFSDDETGGDVASEAELIAALTAIFSSAPSAGVVIGIGDDGAVVSAEGLQILCADMAVEGVHFNRAWSSLYDIGGKITAANLADVYAIGGEPKYLLISAGLTSDFGRAEVEELARGIRDEAALCGAVVVGGDLSSSKELVISISVVGTIKEGHRAITRSGAKMGDHVYISGLPGLSALGLELLKAGRESLHPSAVSQHTKPVLDYSKANSLVGKNVTALIDTSDGLFTDASHLADSSHVCVVLDADLIRAIPGFNELEISAGELEIDTWDLVFGGGEDHRFLCTSPVNDLSDLGFFPIGNVLEGNGVMVKGATPTQKGWSHNFKNS
jgi:thiamine-monophosphate kinase